MKKGIIALGLLLAFGLVGSELMARGGRGCGGGFHHGMFAPGIGQAFHLNRMQEFLKLSDQQVEKIYAINKKYQEKYFQNRKDYDKVEELAFQHRKEIKAVLTKEQLERLDEGWGRGYHGRGPGRGYGDCPGRGW